MGKKLTAKWTNLAGRKQALSVEAYPIPQPQPAKGGGIYYTSFQKTSTALPAGTTASWTIFSSFMTARVIIQQIEVNAVRRDSTGAPQTLNKIEMNLASTIGTSVKSPGLSTLPFRSGGTFPDVVTSSITWQGPPDNTQILFDGPYILETTCNYTLQATARANFALNDSVIWSCVVKWSV